MTYVECFINNGRLKQYKRELICPLKTDPERRLITQLRNQERGSHEAYVSQPEQIIGLLRQAEVELAKGQQIEEVRRKLGITELAYYRWRNEYGGLRTDQAKRFKDLERENARLKKLLAESELDKAILQEAASGNF